VVLSEDLAGILGLTIALLAVGLAIATGNPMFDAAGSISIGLLLMFVALFLGAEIKGLLVGQGVEVKRDKAMRRFLEGRPEIVRLFNLLSLQMGNDVMVAIKAEMVAYPSAADLIAAINRCEADFRAQFEEVVWLFFEPDVSD